jgi:NDP-sugar pyrophosphorylase family protein
MKAVILSAGKGERLGQVTQTIPKPMIKLDGKPILQRNIEWCRSYGVTELFINLHHLPDVITSFFSDGSAFDVKITYQVEKELLGTSGTIKSFESFLKDEPFLVLYGDNAFDYNLSSFINAHKKNKPDMTMAVFHLEDVRHSGVVTINKNGFVTDFVEKPKVINDDVNHGHRAGGSGGATRETWSGTRATRPMLSGGLVNAGLYLMEPELLADIPAGFSDFGKTIIPLFLQKGLRISAVTMDHAVKAVDTPDLYQKWGAT